MVKTQYHLKKDAGWITSNKRNGENWSTTKRNETPQIYEDLLPLKKDNDEDRVLSNKKKGKT